MQFECEVDFLVSGVFQYATHEELIRLQEVTEMKLFDIFQRVGVSGLSFRGLHPILDCAVPDADNRQSHAQEEEGVLSEGVALRQENPSAVFQTPPSVLQTPDE